MCSSSGRTSGRPSFLCFSLLIVVRISFESFKPFLGRMDIRLRISGRSLGCDSSSDEVSGLAVITWTCFLFLGYVVSVLRGRPFVVLLGFSMCGSALGLLGVVFFVLAPAFVVFGLGFGGSKFALQLLNAASKASWSFFHSFVLCPLTWWYTKNKSKSTELEEPAGVCDFSSVMLSQWFHLFSQTTTVDLGISSSSRT